MDISKEKIEEIKKIMGFGYLLVDRIQRYDDFADDVKTKSFEELSKFMAEAAIVYDNGWKKCIFELSEPETTNFIKQMYNTYLEFMKETKK